MNELIDIAELQLDGSLDVVVTRDRSVVADNFQPALQPAPVIVGELQYEQVFKQIFVTLTNGFHRILPWLPWDRSI
ncbi:hypothetical protein D3C77_650230 [compost metagenome]